MVRAAACGWPMFCTRSLEIEKETYIEEFASVLVTIGDADGPAADANVEADSEVGWLEWHLGSVLLEYHLSLEECALRSAAVDLLGFDNLDGPVFEVIVNDEFPDSVVLQAGLHHALFEKPEKSQHLIINTKLKTETCKWRPKNEAAKSRFPETNAAP